MNKVSIDLRHCYRIKTLATTLDFSTERVSAIYAPNGVMKSSLVPPCESRTPLSGT